MEDQLDIFFIPVGWGQTSWIYEDTEERRWLDSIVQKTARFQQEGGTFDVSIQVTIPNEWQPLAPINIGVTAGIETTRVAPIWLEKANMMDKVVTISEFAKTGFTNSFYDGVHKHTREPIRLSYNKDIDIVHYPVKKFKKVDLKLKFKTDFNFLTVSQWGPRKNIENTVRWFVEEFIDQEVGLVVKTFARGGSLIDRRSAELQLKTILSKYEDRKCKVYLLHGDMSEEEMHSLYQHPQIKSFVSLTHGEGFGLPFFEAAYNSLPVIAPDWSGHLDFLYKPTKDKKGKSRKKACFAKVDYDLGPIPKEVVWEGVLVPDSMWCYPQQGSYKMKLREVYKDYGRFKKQAKELQKWILEEFEESKQYKKMRESLLLGTGLLLDEDYDVAAWLAGLDVQVSD
jgi:hypothetical protein